MKTSSIKNKKTKIIMFWFGMGSIFMIFAGLTSALVVSKGRPDWLSEIRVPFPFYISTFILVTISFVYQYALNSFLNQKIYFSKVLIGITFLLSLFFVNQQLEGFRSFIAKGYYFTGELSNIKSSFIYVLVITHLAHLLVGMLSLFIVFIKQNFNKYSKENCLGFRLSVKYWHFLGFIWIYLLVFFLLID